MSHWQSKTKIRYTDTKFSKIIRNRDKWRCQYKFKCYGEEDFSENTGGLHCSHFQKRGKETVRFDIENCDAACAKCHAFVEEDGQKTLEEWKLKQLGERRYNALLIRANTTGKRDDVMTKLYLTELKKEFEIIKWY